MSEEKKLVVATKYVTSKGHDGKFDKKSKRVKSEASLVDASVIDKVNDSFESTGAFYEVDEKETERRFEEGKKKQKQGK